MPIATISKGTPLNLGFGGPAAADVFALSELTLSGKTDSHRDLR
jgi:hypothetical protein